MRYEIRKAAPPVRLHVSCLLPLRSSGIISSGRPSHDPFQKETAYEVSHYAE